MKVLFISTNDAVPWGGSEELWSGAALRLAAKGEDVMASVWEHVPEPSALEHLRSGGVTVHKRYQRPIHRNRFQQAMATLLKGAPPSTLSNELEALDLFRPDFVVFSVGYQRDPKFVRISRILRQRGIRYGVNVQLVIEGLALNDVQCDVLRESYSGAARVWFVSEQNMEATARELGHTFGNAEVVNNPVDLAVVPPPFPPITGGFSLATVGSLTPHHKGQDLLIEVLSSPIWRERPVQVTFYGKGPMEQMLRRSVAHHELKNVQFKGFEKDKQVIWAEHHAGLFPSRMEGRSLAVQEAMAHGRMVIATDVGGAHELITDGETGFLIPFPTVDALDATMQAAWLHNANWETMGNSARERIQAFVKPDPIGRFANGVEQAAAGK